MLSAGNPYVLPSIIAAAVAYLLLSVLTDASLLVRLGVLGILAGVVPILLNRLIGGRDTDDSSTDSSASAGDSSTSAANASTSAADDEPP